MKKNEYPMMTDVIENYCPSDYGLEDVDNCELSSCDECWMKALHKQKEFKDKVYNKEILLRERNGGIMNINNNDIRLLYKQYKGLKYEIDTKIKVDVLKAIIVVDLFDNIDGEYLRTEDVLINYELLTSEVIDFPYYI